MQHKDCCIWIRGTDLPSSLSFINLPLLCMLFLSWKDFCQIICYHIHCCPKTLQILACNCSHPFRSGLGNTFGAFKGSGRILPSYQNSSLERPETWLKIFAQGHFAMVRLPLLQACEGGKSTRSHRSIPSSQDFVVLGMSKNLFWS